MTAAFLKKILSTFLLPVIGCTVTFDAAAQNTPIAVNRATLEQFVKTRGSLDSSRETFVYDEGIIYSVLPDKPIRALMKFRMYNVSRFVPDDSGYTMLSREMLAYLDLKTGAILRNWYNPITGDSNEVFHVWNDPVNNRYDFASFTMPFMKLSNGRSCYYLDIPLYYPSPLKKAEWPQNSRSDMYQAAELFQFFVNDRDLASKKSKSIPMDLSWTRFSDFLPWMKMGDKPGYLMYSSRGSKLKNGWDELPEQLKDFVLEKNPAYRHAPEHYSSPNMTSWKYFRKLMEARKTNHPAN